VFIYFLRAAEGELLLLQRAKRSQVDAGWQPRIMPADNVYIVVRKVAEKVVKRSFPKEGDDPRASGDRSSRDTVPTDADRPDSVLPFLKTPIELSVGATNYLNSLQVWLRRSTPRWLSNRSRQVAFYVSLHVTLSGQRLGNALVQNLDA
jgi:hypothetical protein